MLEFGKRNVGHSGGPAIELRVRGLGANRLLEVVRHSMPLRYCLDVSEIIRHWSGSMGCKFAAKGRWDEIHLGREHPRDVFCRSVCRSGSDMVFPTRGVLSSEVAKDLETGDWHADNLRHDAAHSALAPATASMLQHADVSVREFALSETLGLAQLWVKCVRKRWRMLMVDSVRGRTYRRLKFGPVLGTNRSPHIGPTWCGHYSDSCSCLTVTNLRC